MPLAMIRSPSYDALIDRFPLRPIRSDEDLVRATEVMNELVDRGDALEPDERAYLEVLELLVGHYEDEEHAIRPATHAEMLRHLLESRDVSQIQLAAAIEVSEPLVSMILSGKRELSRANIGKVARYFKVSPALFIQD